VQIPRHKGSSRWPANLGAHVHQWGVLNDYSICYFYLFIFIYLPGRLGRGHSLCFGHYFYGPVGRLPRWPSTTPFMFCFRGLTREYLLRISRLVRQHRHLLPSTNVLQLFVGHLSLVRRRWAHLGICFRWRTMNSSDSRTPVTSFRASEAYKCQEQMSKNCTSARASKG